jgi:phage gp29-like protein
MASPDDYRFAAQGRRSTATGLATAPQTGNVYPIGPVRLASPESDDAEPVEGMLSRSSDLQWLPGAWMKAVTTNDDPMLARDGSGLKLYDALLSDDTAFSTLQQRRLAITSREWEVIPGDDKDQRSVKAADDFRAMVDALGFDRVTGLLHYAVWYGYGVGEGLFEVRDHDGRPIVWLSDIVVPDRRWFGFTAEGELRFIGDVVASIEGVVVPENKFVTVRTGGTHDFAFYGLGLAHWCYWPIFFKRAALKFWALDLEKRGQPTVGIETNQGAEQDKAKKADLLRTAADITRVSAVALPADYITGDKVKIFESTRTSAGSSGFKDFLTEQNESIMRVVLGQPGTSKGVSSGLNSDQASEHADVKAEIVKADADLINDAIQRFGKWLTRWNHGPDVKPPIVRRVLEDAEDLNTTADRDVRLDGIGIKRTEDSVRATYGDGYTLERETPEQKAAREQALAAAKAGGVDATVDTLPNADPATEFSAADDIALNRLITGLSNEANPIFQALAATLRDALVGVKTVEAARIVILEAMEKMDTDALAKLTALPLFAERAAASVGAERLVTA